MLIGRVSRAFTRGSDRVHDLGGTRVGLDEAKSAYVQPNTSGYGTVKSRESTRSDLTPPLPPEGARGIRSGGLVDYTNKALRHNNPFREDDVLAKMIR